MSFFVNALMGLVLLLSFTSTSEAIIIVHTGNGGLSDTARIAIIIVCLVIFFLLLACRLARIRQNRRAAMAGAPVIPITTTQVPNAPNYATQGPGGYNGYTLPPPSQGQYPPVQGYPQNHGQQQGYGQPQAYPPGAYTPGYGPGAEAEKNVGTPPVTDIHTNPQQQHYTAYAPPPGAPEGGFYPPSGPPPGGYEAPGYDAAPPSAPPPAHTTGQDHVGGFRPQ